MKNLPLLLGTLVGMVLLVAGLGFFFSSPASLPVDMTLAIGQATHSKGATTAPVTIVEFSDFQCPACADAQPQVQQVLSQYGDKVRLIYRHFPITELHQHALLAALAAEAAAESNLFWEYHDLLFSTQGSWENLSADAARMQFIEYAAKLGIDKTLFSQRIEQTAARERITSDTADGTKLGVNGTPTFYINGKKTARTELVSSVSSLLTQ